MTNPLSFHYTDKIHSKQAPLLCKWVTYNCSAKQKVTYEDNHTVTVNQRKKRSPKYICIDALKVTSHIVFFPLAIYGARLKARQIKKLKESSDTYQKLAHLPTTTYLRVPKINPTYPIFSCEEGHLEELKVEEYEPKPIDPELAFVLLNTDFQGYDLSNYTTTIENGLALMISSLKEIVEILSEPSKKKVLQLLSQFQMAYNIERLKQALIHGVETHQQFIRAQRRFKTTLLQKLKESTSLYLPSGWAGDPSGHMIYLVLTPSQKDNGAVKVSGRLVNRGAGVNFHPSTVKGKKVVYVSELLLEEVDISKLEDGRFIEIYFQLSFTKRPKDPEISFFEETPIQTTFSANDFYNVFLPAWPGKCLPSNKPPRTAQRGKTCTIKPLMTEMREVLGKKGGLLAKFYITFHAWENYIKAIGVTKENVLQLQELLPKLSRRALKLIDKNLLKEDVKKRVSNFSDDVKREILRVKESLTKEYAEKTLDLLAEGKQENTFSFSFPTVEEAKSVSRIRPEKSKKVKKCLLLEELLTERLKQVKEKLNDQTVLAAVLMARATIANLPPATDATWDTVSSLKALEELQSILLLSFSLKKRGAYFLSTPGVAALFLKILLISYRFARKKLPKDLVDRYEKQIQSLLFRELPTLFCLTHPKDLRDLKENLTLLKQADPNNKRRKSTHYSLDPETKSTLLDERSFQSLQDALEDAEFRYIYDIGKKRRLKEEGLELIKTIYSDPTHKGFDQEYLTLRNSYYLAKAALTFQGIVNKISLKPLHYTTEKNFSDYSFFVTLRGTTPNFEEPFARCYPGFVESDEIKRFLRHTFSDMRYDSHTSLCKIFPSSYSEIDFFPLDLSDYFAMTTEDSLTLVQIEQFFSKNLLKLKQPLIQSIFLTILFKVNSKTLETAFSEALKRSPPSNEIDNFFSFLKSALKKSKNTGSWKTYFFLLRIYSYSLSYCLEYQEETPRTKNYLQAFKKFLQPQSHDQFHDREKFTFSVTLRSLVPNLYGYKKTEGIISMIAEIENSLCFRSLDNEVATNFYLQDDANQGKFILETLQKHVVAKNRPPSFVYDTNTYRSVFDINYPMKQVGDGIYQFIDKHKERYRIQIVGRKEIQLLRLIENNWCLLHERAKDSWNEVLASMGHPAHLYLISYNMAWIKPGREKSSYIINQARNQRLCILKNDRIVHPEKKNLILDFDYKHPIIKQLARISNRNKLLAWRDEVSCELILIELKDFNLTFTREKMWMCKEFPGFFLDPTVSCIAFEPLPNYVIIKNKHETRKVLVTNDTVRAKATRFPRLLRPRTFALNDRTYFQYSIDSVGQIILPDEKKELLFLSYLAMQKGDYRLSLTALNKMALHPEEWEEETVALMQYFKYPNGYNQSDVNTSPKAALVRLKAKILMMQHYEEGTVHLESFRRDYQIYCNQLNNYGVQERLTEDEEEVIKVICHPTSPPSSSNLNINSLEKDWVWLDYEMQNCMITALKNPKPIAFFLRPGITFVYNFLYYYSIIKEGGPRNQIDQIRKLLSATRHDPSRKIACVRKILCIAMQSPKRMPSLNSLLDQPLMLNITKKILSRNHFFFEMQSFKREEKEIEEIKDEKIEVKVEKEVAQAKIVIDEIEDEVFQNIQKQLLRSETVVEDERHVLNEMEMFFEGEREVKDPTVSDENRRLLEGIRHYRKEKEQVDKKKYFINKQAVKQAILALQKSDPALEKCREELTESLKTTHRLEAQAEYIHELSVEEAILFFGKGEDRIFKRSKPELTTRELIKIKEKVAAYLLLQLNAQRRSRLLQQLFWLVKTEKGTVAYGVIETKVIKILQSKRAYDPSKNPHLMVFEYFSNITLRKEQIDALEMLSGPNRKKNIIFEARTGFGKTKAVIPLWLFLTAAPGNISMMTVPKSLYHQTVSYLKKLLGASFKQSVFALQFSRKKGGEIKYLKKIHQMLNRAIEDGMCLLTPIGSLHGLVNLKIKELLSKRFSDGNRLLLEELRGIREKLKKHGCNFFDESRDCFNIHRFYDYAIGTPQPIKDNHLQVVHDLYQMLLSFKLKLDFLNGQMPLEKKEYERTVKEKLASAVAEKFKNKELIPHLMGKRDKKAEAFLTRLTAKEQERYTLYRDQINLYLPITLTRKCNERYGLDKEGTGGRLSKTMHLGVITPNSLFTTPDEMMNFTLQANLKEPFTLDDIETFITQLKFDRESSVSNADFEKYNPLYQVYLTLTNIPLSDCGKGEIVALKDALNNPCNLEKKLSFITGYILPQIKTYPEKISSSCHDVVSAVRESYGASATLNKNLLPPDLNVEENLATPIGTLISLWKHSMHAVYPLKATEPSMVLRELLKQHPSATVFIDIAGLLRDLFDEKKIARLIFETTSFEAVSLYNSKGQNIVYLRPNQGEDLSDPQLRSHCKLPVENIFIFMRQSSVIGSDTPMSARAHAIVTVDSAVELDLFIQGVGRLRGILDDQRPFFAIPKNEVTTFSKEGGITLKGILSKITQSQGVLRGQDLVYNLKLLLNHLVEKQFWTFFHDQTKTLLEVYLLYQLLKNFFVISSKNPSSEALGKSYQEIPFETALQTIRQQFTEKLGGMVDRINQIDLKQALLEFDQLVEKNRHIFPKKTKIGCTTLNTAEVEAEALAVSTQQGEFESDRQQDAAYELPVVFFTSVRPINPDPYPSLGINHRDLALNHFHPQFEKLLDGVFGSTNFFRINRSGRRPYEIMKTAYEILIIRADNQYQMVLMDQKDAKRTLLDMVELHDEEKKEEKREYYLLSSTGKVIAKDATVPFDRQEWEENPRLTLLAKAFTRNFMYTQKEIAFLKENKKIRDDYLMFFKEHMLVSWPPILPHFERLIKRIRTTS